MAMMMTTVAQLRSWGAANTMSVNTEIAASASSTRVNGLTKEKKSFPGRGFFFPWVSTFFPHLSLESSAVSLSSPPGPVPYLPLISPSLLRAAQSIVCACFLLLSFAMIVFLVMFFMFLYLPTFYFCSARW